MADIYHQDPEFQVFRKGLKQQEDQLERKIEALRDRDKELVKVVARNSELEVSLEDALRIVKLELTEEKEASGRWVAMLEGRVKELEAELTALDRQIASLRAENARRHSQPSTSRASADPIVPYCLYELWVHAEARLYVYKAFHALGRDTEVEVQVVHTEAHVAHESCGYDPLTPDGDDINSDDANCLTSDSWYENTYPARDDV
ncbi:uncharacterized protein [Nicotiana sylvestris]|uniref:uncharacterized protein n=1 Tax=Nicotiana sylvestris TaxID=4096 RepID=UPI00388C4118